jgi:beta-lactamase regulating signal transducer with metallopeptidase domain
MINDNLFIPGVMVETIIKAVGVMFLHSLWQGILVALAGAVFMLLTKGLSPAFRYRLLCSCFIIFIGGCLYTFIYQYHLFAVTSLQTLPAATGYVTHNNVIATKITIADTIVQWCSRNSFVIVATWFMFFLIRLISLVRSLLVLEQVRHNNSFSVAAEWEEKFRILATSMNIRIKILFRQSALVAQPVVIGFLKPVLLVPVGMLAQLPPEQAEAILLHELAHIRRNDFLINLLQTFAETVFFFNPGLLFISSLIRNEREYCCDRLAVEKTGSKKEFIRALVSFHELQPQLLKHAMAFGAPGGLISKRVDRIINSPQKNDPMAKIVTVVALSLVFILIVSFSFTQSVQTNKAKLLPETLPLSENALMAEPKDEARLTTKKIAIQNSTFHSLLHDTIPQGASKEFIAGYKAGMNYRDHPFGDTALEKIEKRLIEAYQQKTLPDDETRFSLLFLAEKKKEEELMGRGKTDSSLLQSMSDKKRMEEFLQRLKKTN